MDDTKKRADLKAKILLLSENRQFCDEVKTYYEPRGYEFDVETDSATALSHIKLMGETHGYDVVIVNGPWRVPHGDQRSLVASTFLNELRLFEPSLPLIVASESCTVETAMQAVREGAFDLLTLPINYSYLSLCLERIHDQAHISLRNSKPSGHKPHQGDDSTEKIVAHSQAMLNVVDLAKKVAPSVSTVLIQGESGAGKEILARYIHKNSTRLDGPFVALNCSAIPESLLESELFGYVKGAFTGAQDRRVGLFEEANSGTLFLDEIADLSQPLQAKLLRVIQERKIKRLGENTLRPIDVRLLAATNKVMSTEVKEGRFRQDLYYRLAVIRISLPPLRERVEDILPLAHFFLHRYASRNGRFIRGFSPEAESYLLSQTWTGNVRELENAIERAVVLCDKDWISRRNLSEPAGVDGHWAAKSETHAGGGVDHHQLVEHCGTPWKDQAPLETLPPTAPPESKTLTWPGIQLDDVNPKDLPSLEDISLRYVTFVLSKVKGVKERAARILKIDRKTLYRRLEEMNGHHRPLN